MLSFLTIDQNLQFGYNPSIRQGLKTFQMD